jgi:alpha,alpha-trehalase
MSRRAVPARFRLALCAALAAAMLATPGLPLGLRAQVAVLHELPAAERIAEVRRYIKAGWSTLSRSLRDLPAAAQDPKMAHTPGQPWPVYYASTETRRAVDRAVAAALPPASRRMVSLRVLPAAPLTMTAHGLLFLPRPYVVPGGRFNEMYGWDSYFIQVGLLRDDELERARDMVENHLYQVRHYGKVLNANRTYYLSRSQPPFLTQMVLGVFARTKDATWLRSILPLVDTYYDLWVGEPHLLPFVGLSRYYDLGDVPAPEVVSDERDAEGRTHYDRVRAYYKTHEVPDYDVADYYDRAADALTPLFYRADRTMRESGFDPSNRFGPFNIDILNYAPVCLNSLLYQMEVDRADIAGRLGDAASAARWRERAERRKELVNRYLWDEAGLYFDYNVKTGRRRHYEFATTFYPLWVGLATPEQAKQVVANLHAFEAEGGILTSTTVTGNQWDAPFGWAPLQMAAVNGLRRYGFTEDADRLATKFIALVTKEFQEHGVIVEKYDVVRRESDVSAGIRYGYSSNEIGFGWTNAVYLELLAGLQESASRSGR